VSVVDPLAVADHGSDDVDDPDVARPVPLDVLWRFSCPQDPGHVAPMPFLVILCGERNLAVSLELAVDLTVQRLLVALHSLEHVGPLG